MTSKVFKYAGIAAGIVLIAIGIGSVVTGVGGRSTVHDNLGLEQITGSPDMNPKAITAEAKAAGLKGVALPTCSVADKPINTGGQAKCFASYIRIHALEATGGRTYSQMGQYLTAAGKETSDKTAAAIDPKTGKPVAQRRAQHLGHRDRADHRPEHRLLRRERRALRDPHGHRPAADRHRAARPHRPVAARAGRRRADDAHRHTEARRRRLTRDPTAVRPPGGPHRLPRRDRGLLERAADPLGRHLARASRGPGRTG